MPETTNPAVVAKLGAYPQPIREKLLSLRQLILETAQESSEVGDVEETLKWGEASYLCNTGSTIRIDWKASSPEQYQMYFHCKTSLIDSFRELHGDLFRFQGNRAIVFALNDEIPVSELKQCILLALSYHRRKHLPLLGA